MDSYVVFLWNEGYRNYLPEHVNMLARAIKYWDTRPHRFVVVTEETQGFSEDVEVFPLPRSAKQVSAIPAPQGGRFPSCYRRLWCFSEEAQALGDRIMVLDIDCMAVGDLIPLWDYSDADFVGWRPMSIWGRENRIGGGTWIHRPGTISSLWDNFLANPVKMIQETKEKGWNGSDQAIMSRFLVPKYPVWPQHFGIYGSQDGVFEWEIPPKDAKIVHFNGDEKPWGNDKLWMRAYCNHFGERHGKRCP